MQTCKVAVTAIDPSKKRNRYFPVIRDSILATKKIKGRLFDFISCISVLEHIKDYETAVKNMAAMLNSGGTLVMTFPFKNDEFVENAYALHGAGYKYGKNICRQYSGEILYGFEKYGLELCTTQHWKIFTGDYWSQGERLETPIISTTRGKHHLACVSFAKN
jgi:hypothetical protein